VRSDRLTACDGHRPTLHGFRLRFFHVDPLTGFGGFEDGVADVLGAEGVAEVRVGLRCAWIVEGFEELGEFVDEGVFVTEAEAGNPVVAGIRVIAIGGVDGGPAAAVAGDAVVEIAEVVEIVKIPSERFLFAVDFEGVQRFVAAGVTSGFEDGERAVFKPGEEGAGIVDGDRVFGTGFGMDALFDEGFGHRGNGNDFAVDPAGGVDAVSKKVTGYAGACGCCIEAPETGAALGKFFGNGPVLQEIRAVVENAAEFASVDDVFRQGHGWEEPVVVPNEVWQTGFFDGFDHFLTLLAVEGEGFFAKDHLAVFDALKGDLGVGIVWCANVDGVNVIAFDEFAPVGLVGGVAPFFGKGGDFFLIPTANDLANRYVLGVEKVGHLRVGVRVGATHEAITDEADADFFFHDWNRLMLEKYWEWTSNDVNLDA